MTDNEPATSSSSSSKQHNNKKHVSDTEDEEDAGTAGGSGDVSGTTKVPPRFSGQTLYQVLGVSKDATAEQIKKAYRRMALTVHPDLNKAPNATEEFQFLSRCHEVLSDANRRKIYDATGSLESSEGHGEGEGFDMDAYEYWRRIFPKITKEDIETYRGKYEGSQEEVEDVQQAYEQYDGDLALVFESVPFASLDSLERLIAVLKKECHAKITAKQVKELKQHLQETEGAEAEEAEEALKELSAKDQALMRKASKAKKDGASDEDALAMIMQQRAKDRERSGQAFLAHMEAKYAAPKKGGASSSSAAKKGGKRKAKEEVEEEDGDGDATMAEPSEDEFAAIQARMMARQKAAKASPAKKSKK